MNITHDMFSHLEITFNGKVSHPDHLESLDLGSIELKHNDSGRNWTLDVLNSHWEENTITAHLDDLVGTQEIFPKEAGEHDYNLRLADLNDALDISFYLGGESDLKVISATLVGNSPDGEFRLSAIPDSKPDVLFMLMHGLGITDNACQMLFKAHYFELFDSRISLQASSEGIEPSTYSEPLERCSLSEFVDFLTDFFVEDEAFTQQVINTALALTLAQDNCFEISPQSKEIECRWSTDTFDEVKANTIKNDIEKMENCIFSVDVSDPSYENDDDEETETDGWIVVDVHLEFERLQGLAPFQIRAAFAQFN